MRSLFWSWGATFALWTLETRSYNDLTIFRESLATWLEPGERVEADGGNVGEAPLEWNVRRV